MARTGHRIASVKPELPVTQAAAETLRLRLSPLPDLVRQAGRKGKVSPEVVHALRVGSRRAAAALRVYAETLPREGRRWWERRLRKWRRRAGVVRRFDVLLRRLMERKADAAFIEQLQVERAAAFDELRERLQSGPSEQRLAGRQAELIQGIRWRAEQEPSVAEWAAQALAAELDAFLAAEPKVRGDLAALHAFRIAGKRLRYALELLAAVRGGSDDSLLAQVEEFQSRLGAVQDGVDATGYFGRSLESIRDVRELQGIERHLKHESAALRELLREFWMFWRGLRGGIRRLRRQSERRGK